MEHRLLIVICLVRICYAINFNLAPSAFTGMVELITETNVKHRVLLLSRGLKTAALQVLYLGNRPLFMCLTAQ